MNTTGKKFGGRKKGTPNKLTAEVKEKIKRISNLFKRFRSSRTKRRGYAYVISLCYSNG